MCYNILEKTIQPEPFAWLCILRKHNATHYSLLNSADAEQARSHSKTNSQKTQAISARDQRTSATADKILQPIVKRLRPPLPCPLMPGPRRTAPALLIFS
jgi:hypothetical protein